MEQVDFDDYATIIIWNSSKELVDLVKSNFQVLGEFKFDLTKTERAEKLKKLYQVDYSVDADARTDWVDPITFFFIKTRLQYDYRNRAEGLRLCNLDVLNFKIGYRGKYPYTYFHCSDNIEEANHSLDVFNLSHLKVNYKILSIDDIYTLLYKGDKYIEEGKLDLEDTLKNDKFDIIKFKENPIIKYIMGFEEFYFSAWHRFDPRPDTIKHFINNDFNYCDPLCQIRVIPFGDKYLIFDGLHRASALYAKGFRDLYVKIYDQQSILCGPYLSENKILPKQLDSHLENFNKFIYELNNNNVNFIIIRGYNTMPKTPNTDLDIVIHPDSYSKFKEVADKFKLLNLIKDVENPIYQSFENNHYYAFSTNGIYRENIHAHCYYMDTYNNIFFFMQNNKTYTVKREFLDYVFNTKKRYHTYHIPNEYSDVLMNICRCVIDKRNFWTDKYLLKFKNTFNSELFNLNELRRLFNMFLGDDFINQFNFNLEDLINRVSKF